MDAAGRENQCFEAAWVIHQVGTLPTEASGTDGTQHAHVEQAAALEVQLVTIHLGQRALLSPFQFSGVGW